MCICITEFAPHRGISHVPYMFGYLDARFFFPPPDIDECASGSHSCSPFANCTNSNGSFSCNCGSGFTGDGMTCNGE